MAAASVFPVSEKTYLKVRLPFSSRELIIIFVTFSIAMLFHEVKFSTKINNPDSLLIFTEVPKSDLNTSEFPKLQDSPSENISTSARSVGQVNSQPIAEQASQLLRNESLESFLKQGVQPALNDTSESVAKQDLQPVTNQTSESIPKTEGKPGLDRSPESFVKQVAQPALNQSSGVVLEQGLQSASNQSSESVVIQDAPHVSNHSSESVLKQAVQPVLSRSSEADVKPATQTAVERHSPPIAKQLTSRGLNQSSESVAKQPSDRAMNNSSLLQPLVSVIVTTHNVEKYICETLNATLRQTYQNLQIIIIDDASTDNTASLIKNFTASDSRVSFIRLSTGTFGGTGTPSNIGINLAEGKYLTFVDGDDIPKSNFIERLVTVSEKSGADLTYCTYNSFSDSGGKKRRSWKVRDLGRWPSKQEVNRSQTHPLQPWENSKMFRMNPVPWRKLYRTTFLHNHNIFFPEGGFFFEDLSLHWLVTMHASNVSFLNETLVQHRVGHSSQTTSVFRPQKPKVGTKDWIIENAKVANLAGEFANTNYIGRRVANCAKENIPHCSVVRQSFIQKLKSKSLPVFFASRSSNKKLTEKFKSIENRVRQYWYYKLAVGGIKAPKYVKDTGIDLSIVVAAYNAEKFLPNFVRLLKNITVTTEVFFVDNNSTDRTLMMMKEISDANRNMYVLHKSEPGAGRARNLGLTCSEGRYVMFLDIDDVFDPSAIDSAVLHATSEDLEVLMLKYKLEYVRNGNSEDGFEVKFSKGMFNSDEDLWKQSNTNDLAKRKILAARMINYPWNKLVKWDLLIREGTFFGTTTVQNDVQYHWHAIFQARSVGFFERAVVRHRKFEERKTLTDTGGKTRFALIDALAMTNRALVISGLEHDVEFRNAWRKFSKRLVGWGRSKVGKSLLPTYSRKTEELFSIIDAEGGDKALLVT